MRRLSGSTHVALAAGNNVLPERSAGGEWRDAKYGRRGMGVTSMVKTRVDVLLLRQKILHAHIAALQTVYMTSSESGNLPSDHDALIQVSLLAHNSSAGHTPG